MDIKRIIIIDETIIDRLTDLVDGFIREANEYDMEHKDAMALIDTIVRTNKGALFGVYLKGEICGYLAMELCTMNISKIVSIVHQMYLNKFAKGDQTFHDLVQEGVRWSKDNGAQHIYFTTRRNSEAFQRLLGDGWTIDSTVLGLKL